MQIEVTRDVIEAMRSAARSAHPHEACGILFGRPLHVSLFVQARNVHREPATHFEIDPAILIAAHRAERAGGPAVVGYFHSHPNGSAEPSKTDCAEAAKDGSIWAIIAQDDVRFYRSGERGFEPLSFTEIDG